jgi:hypothetical protein
MAGPRRLPFSALMAASSRRCEPDDRMTFGVRHAAFDIDAHRHGFAALLGAQGAGGIIRLEATADCRLRAQRGRSRRSRLGSRRAGEGAGLVTAGATCVMAAGGGGTSNSNCGMITIGGGGGRSRSTGGGGGGGSSTILPRR